MLSCSAGSCVTKVFGLETPPKEPAVLRKLNIKVPPAAQPEEQAVSREVTKKAPLSAPPEESEVVRVFKK